MSKTKEFYHDKIEAGQRKTAVAVNTETCSGRCFFKENGVRCAACEQVCQTVAKAKKSSRAFGVYPDSVGIDLSSENKLIAVFKYEFQARMFAANMWGRIYVIKQLLSEHFH